MSVCSWYILCHLLLGVKHNWIKANNKKDFTRGTKVKVRSLTVRQSNLKGSILSGLGRATKPFAIGRLLGVT